MVVWQASLSMLMSIIVRTKEILAKSIRILMPQVSRRALKIQRSRIVMSLVICMASMAVLATLELVVLSLYYTLRL